MAMTSAQRSKRCRDRQRDDMIEVSIDEVSWTSLLIAMGVLEARDQEDRAAVEEAFGKLHDLLLAERLNYDD
jgi:hypothetical protein